MDDNSFFSVDRLLEFGMSMAVAQQMINTMNQAMREMHVPGAQNVMMPSPPQVYYAIVDSCQTGPLSDADMLMLINQHRINKDSYIWMPGMVAWKTAADVPSLMRLVAMAPPPFENGR